MNVIPAEAGIQFVGRSWTPAFAGVTKKYPHFPALMPRPHQPSIWV